MSSLGDIVVPDIGGVSEVDVIEILVQPGDLVEIDTPLITLESDKATMEVPSTAAGKIKEIKVKIGDKLAEGSVILTLEQQQSVNKAEDSAVNISEQQQDLAKPPNIENTATKQQNLVSAATMTVQEDFPANSSELGVLHAGPSVRKLARELGIDLAQVKATGPKCRILKKDLQDYVKLKLQNSNTGGNLPVAPEIDFSQFGEIKISALSRLKKISGKNLQRSWISAPMVTQFGDADITRLEDFRKSKKQEMQKQGIRLTPIAFILKTVVKALEKFPEFNASLDVMGENLILKKYFHIGVAVDTPDGLVVPVLRDVNKKTVLELAQELGELSEKARQKKLMPKDMQGGSFTISSLGGIGGTAFTPIVNVPEVAILGVAKAAIKPVYVDGVFVPRTILPLSLTYDHRVIDGADGARFIVYLGELLADIRNILL